MRFLLGERFTAGLGPQASIKTWKSSDIYDNFVFGAVGGIEYNISGDVFIDLRAGYKFNNMLDEDVVGSGFDASQFNIQLGVGIKL